MRSADDRIVSAGLVFVSLGNCVMDERKSGHSIMEIARVLRRNGRYVSLANLALSGIAGGWGAGCREEGFTI